MKYLINPIYNRWGFLFPYSIYIKNDIMKHILNNLSEEVKNSIREQHTGGMSVNTDRFKTLMESKLGNVKPMVSEEERNLGYLKEKLVKR